MSPRGIPNKPKTTNAPDLTNAQIIDSLIAQANDCERVSAMFASQAKGFHDLAATLGNMTGSLLPNIAQPIRADIAPAGGPDRTNHAMLRQVVAQKSAQKAVKKSVKKAAKKTANKSISPTDDKVV